MMKKTLIIIILLPILMGSIKIHAQKIWGLDECLVYALDNNLSIVSQGITNATNRENLAQNRRDFMPYVNARSNYSINIGKSVDPNTNTVIYRNFASNSYNLQGGISLFEGFVRSNRIAWSKFTYLAGIENQKAIEIEIAFKVMEAYYNTLYYEGLLDIVREQKKLSEINLEKVRKESDIGISAKTDVLEIEARMAEEELQEVRTENNLKASIIQLKKAMNYPLKEELLLGGIEDQEPVESSVYENADTVYSLALRYLPDVKAKELELKAVEKSLAISRGATFPTLSMSGSYNTGYYETYTDNQGNIIGFKEQITNNNSKSFGLSLSVPLFNQWSTRSDIKKSKLELEKKRVDLTDYKNQLYYDIESYCQDLTAAEAEYTQASKQEESNRLAYEVAEKKREQGLLNIIDFYTSKNLLSNAQSEMLRTRIQFLLKKKSIGFYMGEPLLGNPVFTNE